MDRIETQLDGQVSFVRVNVASAFGVELARRYDIHATPTLVVLDTLGKVVYSHVGVPNAAQVVAAVETLR